VLAATQSALVDQLGEGDPGALLEERQRELREAEAAARAAVERERSAREQLDEVRRAAAEAGQMLGSIRERLAAAHGALGIDAVTRSGTDGITDAFERLTTAIDERARAATARGLGENADRARSFESVAGARRGTRARCRRG
jgi:hypothetical protein